MEILSKICYLRTTIVCFHGVIMIGVGNGYYKKKWNIIEENCVSFGYGQYNSPLNY
jgi:uncharacterized membrane protein